MVPKNHCRIRYMIYDDMVHRISRSFQESKRMMEYLTKKPKLFAPIELTCIGSNTSTARVCRHGGHITHYQPHGHEPVLWVSPLAQFQSDKAIRGGIPICFPWFGPHPSDPQAPAHGLVRTQRWNLQPQTPQHTRLRIDLDDWAAQLDMRLGPNALTTALTFTNITRQAQPVSMALHTYLAVSDVHDISVHGLENTTYLDQLQDMARITQPNEPIRFTQETDRIYIDAPQAVTVSDPGMQRDLTVEKTGSESTVVWTPWSTKAARMADVGEHWPGFVCIETANAADNTLVLEPRQTHTISSTIRVKHH